MKKFLRTLLTVWICLSLANVYAGSPDKIAKGQTKNFANSQTFNSYLLTSTNVLADGNLVVFDQLYSNDVDGWDAVKFMNAGENFGMKRSGYTLAVEARQPLSADTLFFNMTNLYAQNYKLLFIPQEMANKRFQAELIDNYLHTRTPVSLSDSTYINFPVENTAGSKAPNRLMVVFSAMSALPVTFTAVTAGFNADKTPFVKWNVENEINIEQYFVEMSKDGTGFFPVAKVSAAGNTGTAASYTQKNVQIEGQSVYYRIKSVSLDGLVQYSKIVKLVQPSVKAGFTFFPNPMTGNSLQVQFLHQPKGKYTVALKESSGKLISSTGVDVTGDQFTATMHISAAIAPGLYYVIVTDGNAVTTVSQLVRL